MSPHDDPTGDLAGAAAVDPPAWWGPWWERFRREDWRRLRRLIIAMVVVVSASALVSAVNLIQADQLRDEQARTLAVLEGTESRPDDGLLDLLHDLAEVEARIEGNTSAVAAYVAELRARAEAAADQNGASSDAVARGLVTIERIRLALEDIYGGPLPELPPAEPGG